ncbi:MAG TPA: molybdopterin-dependent oxidoreductase [Rhodocyclaceae bacterium]|nr:molybdopterin-dependent oxidoreductase [Rhodocyclaceae bacterium]
MDISRRGFLTLSAVAGLGAGTLGFSKRLVDLAPFTNRGRKALHPIYGNANTPEWLRDPKTDALTANSQWTLHHTVDLQCHSECGLRVKIDRKTGRVQRIIGNPYHPNTLSEYTACKTPLIDTARHPGTVCARGNSGIQTAYDPYRVMVPLKRVGPRGSGQWKPISWETLIADVTEGGKIFADTGDAMSMGLDVLGFRGLYAKRDELMDADAPELGKRTNGFVVQGGRLVGTRMAFFERFAHTFGSINVFDHVNVCELSHHIGHQHVFSGINMTQPDVREAKFIIYWGTQPGDANFPMQIQGKFAAEARAKADGLKYVVVDPKLSRGGVVGDRASWLPIKPGTDGALALAMIRWIIDNNRYNAAYLSYPTQAAAVTAGELSHTDASHLVIVDPKHPQARHFLTAQGAGLGSPRATGEDDRVVLDAASGKPAQAGTVKAAQIEYAGTVNGVAVKSAFRLLREAAEEHSIEQYAAICGIEAQRIVAVAREFTSHGRQAISTMYRGVVKHPNGYYNGVAVLLLNLLIGNMNWTGGLTAGGGGYNVKKGLYDIESVPEAEGLAKGVIINREKVHYEDTSEYKAKVAAGQNPYPSKRPWFPLSANMFTETLPSAIQRYPYGVDILMWHKATPLYSVPSQGNPEFIEAMKNPKNIPLIIASDIVVGDSSMYADYILPDVSYLESYDHVDTFPTTLTKGTGVRWPAVSLTPTTADGRHFCAEEFLIDVAKRIKMPGYGEKGIPDAAGKFWPLNRREDFYLKATANLVNAKGVDGDEVPKATAEEIAISDLASYQKQFADSLKAEEWPAVLGCLVRGGRFQPVSGARKGDKLAYQYTKRLHFYAEKVATTRNSMNGEFFHGTTRWVEPTTASGKLLEKLDDPKDWPLTIITMKGALQSHSRLASNYTLREINPGNGVQVAAEDARRLGIANGDWIWVVTPEGKRRGRAMVLEGIRPGVILFEAGYGHWGYGASNYRVGGKRVVGDAVRRAGIHLNPIMRRDPDVWQMSLMDLTGGSVVFYNTRARIEKDVTHV